MKDTDIIVTDWRVLISSFYCDADVGKCGFEAPNGRVNGERLLKKIYEIENGELQEYFDADLVSNDGLLQKYLLMNIYIMQNG